MSDLAHPRVSDEFIAAVFAVMGLADRHRYQVLTKRPRRLRALLQKDEFRGLVARAMVRRKGDPELVSAEPLLEDITDGLHHPRPDEGGRPVLSAMDWVIAGGESGPTNRPMDRDWARGVRDACLATAVPFFFKQWGGRTPKAGGRTLDGVTWDQMPDSSSQAESTASLSTAVSAT